MMAGYDTGQAAEPAAPRVVREQRRGGSALARAAAADP